MPGAIANGTPRLAIACAAAARCSSLNASRFASAAVRRSAFDRVAVMQYLSAVITRLVRIAQLERVIQYSRDFSDSTETPRRTGYPAFAGYDGTRAGRTKSQATKTKVRSRERR